jgi:hypothetical protein
MFHKVISDVWAGLGLLTAGGWVPPLAPNPVTPLASPGSHSGGSVLGARMAHFVAATDSYPYGRCTSACGA